MGVRLASRRERVDRRVHHGGVEVGAGGVTWAGGVNRTVGVTEHLDDGCPVVEVDDGWGGAEGSEGRGFRVVADERGHIVSVGQKLAQDVGSDEPGCAGECDLHWCYLQSFLQVTDGSLSPRAMTCGVK